MTEEPGARNERCNLQCQNSVSDSGVTTLDARIAKILLAWVRNTDFVSKCTSFVWGLPTQWLRSTVCTAFAPVSNCFKLVVALHVMVYLKNNYILIVDRKTLAFNLLIIIHSMISTGQTGAKIFHSFKVRCFVLSFGKIWFVTLLDIFFQRHMWLGHWIVQSTVFS